MKKAEKKECPSCKMLRLQMEELKREFELGMAERRKIEKAKWILVKSKQISEEEAHKFILDAARRERKKIIDIASALIDGEKYLSMNLNADILEKISKKLTSKPES